MIVTQETISLINVTTNPQQVMSQKLYGMIELILRGLRNLLF